MNRKRPAGRALGLAYSDIWETYVAMVAGVSVDRKTGNVNVHELWSAVDTGVALQPANVRAQVESAAVWGVSALRERLLFKDGVPPVAPAVANAVFKLTGKRLRDLPFKQELLKA